MSPNPNSFYPEPTRDISPSQIKQRTFNPDFDAIRTFIVGGELIFDIGDVKIGAVEIEDRNSGTRLDVEVVRDFQAAIVRDAVEFQKTKVNNFGSAMVSPSINSTLVTYTVPSGATFTFTGAIVGGDEIGEFTMEIGGNVVTLVRNSGSNRTIQLRFVEPPDAGESTEIAIRVTNTSDRTRQFEATLSGFILPS